MKSMSIHTYKYDKPGMFKMEDVEAYRKKLENGSWSCPVRVRTQNGSSDICSRSDADQTNEMVIMTAEPLELTFVHLRGRLSIDDLKGMGDQLRVLGFSEVDMLSEPARPSNAREPARQVVAA